MCQKRTITIIKTLAFFLIIIIDQSSKQLAIKNLLPFFGGFFEYTVCNPYIAWGLPIKGVYFIVLWIFTISIILYLLKKEKYNIFLIFVIAAAISNLIDRIRFSCVIDFINTPFFPSFNFADMVISTSVIIFTIQNFKKEFSKKVSNN